MGKLEAHKFLLLSFWDPVFSRKDGEPDIVMDLYVYLFYNLLHDSFLAFSRFSCYVKTWFFPPKKESAVLALDDVFQPL